ncbi:MAG: voltage-gated chloride channel family protein [Polyangiales bacterium]
MLARRARVLAEWLTLGALVGVLCGAASALFLHGLERATRLRVEHEWLVWTLPLAGLGIGALYHALGTSVKGGTGLVIDSLHVARGRVPLRMGPLVLIGTLLTHLFGGSAGREGTAVQIGASLSDGVARALGLRGAGRRRVVIAGIAGGFGSVFGTPIAGALFGLEVARVGRVEYDALLPALVAALVGDWTTRALGVVHTAYPHPAELALSPAVGGKWLLFGLACGGVAWLFIELLHRSKRQLERWAPSLPVRMMLGGCVVVGLWRVAGSDYLGLGVPTIVRAFVDPHLPWAAFAWKLVFTVATLGAGFLGGEVTPLFFVGAALGNVLGRLLGLPLDLAAGVGLVAVFGAAANTPLALSIMAVELLGAHVFPHALLVVVVAYLAAGHRGIYPTQRVAHGKLARRTLEEEVALTTWTDEHDHQALDAEAESEAESKAD